MKRTEIELIALQLVQYVESHPQCTRGQATRSIPAHISTVQAWNMIKHLFDYGKNDGAYANYTRNSKPFSFERSNRLYKSDPKPSSLIFALAETMQKLVDESDGITGEKIRKVMQLDMVAFKPVSRLLKAIRQRGCRRTATYYPVGYKHLLEPSPAQIASSFKYAELAKYNGVILTQWRIAPPWLLSNTAN